MFRNKRVPTILSNYQKDEGEEGGGSAARGCGRNCFRNCCLPGSKLPLYAFPKSPKAQVCEQSGIPFAFLDSLLLGEWEDRMERGLFRYDVTTCETKMIQGEHGFIAQLNEGRRLKKRPTELQVDKVLQDFDENMFNFTQVGQEDVLFQFEPSEDGEVHFYPNAPIDHVDNSPSVVAINVSPIEYGHVLLIPRILNHLPQRIDHESLLLALYMAREAGSPYFRVGYNSLGAFATVNHLHFQAYYLAVPFPLEKAASKKITDINIGVEIYEILNYPVRGLVFEGGNSLEDLSDSVADTCICLQDHNIPYNMLISESGKRVFVLPQCYAEKQALGEVSAELLETQVNPGVWEISGHMVLKRKEDYEGASEKKTWRLLEEVSLSEERFQEVMAIIFETISCAAVEKMSPKEDKQDDVDEVGGVKGDHHATVVSGNKHECLVQH